MSAGHVVITGGAGFVGANLANRLLLGGERVVLFDNLSRPSVGRNVAWLRAAHGERVSLQAGDVRDRVALTRAFEGATHVFHLAAQVAVTRSLADPVADFEVNARGTLNVLETIRAMRARPPLFFTSTNKVYGSLSDVALRLTPGRVEPVDPWLSAHGIGEGRRIDFHSPYGCSKGAAEQYVLDYVRSYDLEAVVLRMSCIYGPRQFGSTDQGWLAHFIGRALGGGKITIYGDGKQVRDVLYVDDLVDAFLLARRRLRHLSGSAFNLGGGPRHTTSLLELLHRIEELEGRRPVPSFEEARPGDQRYYVSDSRRFASLTGWVPRVDVREGVRRLHAWLRELAAEPGSSEAGGSERPPAAPASPEAADEKVEAPR